MRRRVLGLVAALATLAPLAGCGGSGSGGGGGMGDHTDVTGTWDVTFAVTGGTAVPLGQRYNGTLMLVQTGMDVTGSFPTPGGSTADLEGMVVGQALTFTITEDPPCAGTATGERTIDAAFNRIDGTSSGSDCYGTVEADFVAIRR